MGQILIHILALLSFILLQSREGSSLTGLDRVQWKYTNYGAHSQQLLSYKNKVCTTVYFEFSLRFNCCFNRKYRSTTLQQYLDSTDEGNL